INGATSAKLFVFVLLYRYFCICIRGRSKKYYRYGISDPAVTSIASAVLQDIGIVHEGETSHVVDRNKIRRQRKKVQNAAAESTKCVQCLDLF
ncbi:hypothetical protein AVEN_198566-1, partial [Araneus ventricosus]